MSPIRRRYERTTRYPLRRPRYEGEAHHREYEVFGQVLGHIERDDIPATAGQDGPLERATVGGEHERRSRPGRLVLAGGGHRLRGTVDHHFGVCREVGEHEVA